MLSFSAHWLLPGPWRSRQLSQTVPGLGDAVLENEKIKAYGGDVLIKEIGQMYISRGLEKRRER